MAFQFRNPLAKRVRTFCAFCKSPRRVYRKRRIGMLDILASILGALALMGFVFQDWDPRAILFFVFFLAVAETFIQLRWRMGLSVSTADLILRCT
jgi:heme/copper-type cytochrome/quinol oxidase subunit 4